MRAVRLVMLIEFTNRTSACLAILLMALFSGCSPLEEEASTSSPLDAPAFAFASGPLADAALAAADRWERATGLSIDVVEGLPVYVLPLEDVRRLCGAGAHACVMPTGDRRLTSLVYREDWVGAPEAEPVLTHEFGHALLMRYGDDPTDLGLAHHAIPGIMRRWWEEGLTEELLTIVCMYQPCTTFVPEEP
jgi:hypothetical protein